VRDWLAGLTLRVRLVVAMMGMTAVCLSLGVSSIGWLHYYLLHRLDGQLERVGTRLVAAVSDPTHRSVRAEISGHGLHLWLAQEQQVGTLGALIQNDKLRVAGVLNRNGFTHVIGDDKDLLAVPADGHAHTRLLDNRGEYRMMAVPLPANRVFVTGLPLKGVSETLSRLSRIELLVGLGALIVSGFVSTFAAKIALRPLIDVAATAGRVSSLQLARGEIALAERVPVENADPRTEVGRVGNALNRMLENLTSALEARHASETQLRQFLADSSHELRTPLAVIRGEAELIRHSSDEGLPPEVAHAIPRIAAQAERMSSLVDDMSLLARLDAGPALVREPVDLSKIIVDAISDAQVAGIDHRWTLQLPVDPVRVIGDPTRLAHVVGNLLMNARVHTPPGTSIRAELESDAEIAVLRVIDNGPGVPVALQPHVFGRFARGDSSRSRAAGSTGLGLAIAHAVVIAHRGTISLESRPGCTVFSVALPRGDGAPIGGP
jgi:two-component system OmpR family sensor kinase